MRPEIDLTPDREFSDFHKNNGLYKKKYQHKSIPWKNDKTKSACYKYDDITWYIDDNLSLTILDNSIQENLDTIGNIVTFNTSSQRNNLSLTSGGFSYNNNSSTTRVSYKLEFSNSLTQTEDIKNFPTGKRKDIIRKRKYAKNDKRIPTYVTCKNCRKLFKEKPWNNSTDTSFCSEDCYDRYMDSLIYNKAKKVNKMELWGRTEYSRFSKRPHKTTMKRCNALCISSDYPDEGSVYEYSYKELPWSHFDTYEGIMAKDSWSLPITNYGPISKKVLLQALYYKGKYVPQRGEKLQPKGRVPQEYDEIFNRLDWREMLLERLDNEEKRKKQEKIKERIIEDSILSVIDEVSHTINWISDINLTAI